MSAVTLISFYTNDWKYPQHAKRLKTECQLLKINNVIEELSSTGSYLKNTCLKPKFILDKLNEIKAPVLWVDVDGSILKYPSFFEDLEGFDFAARLMPDERKRTWHVGTMWFNYTPQMIEFIEHWIDNTGKLSDESALDKTWKDWGYLINDKNIPEEYFYIEQKGKHTPKDTVILHRISSGEVKKKELPRAIKIGKEGIY